MVYFGGRDAANQSRLFVAELDPARLEIRTVHQAPALDIGAPGAFDESGVGPGTAIDMGDKIRLYYPGIRLRDDVPYEICIGVAESTDGGKTFQRLQTEPVLCTNPKSPLGATSPTVYRTEDGWEMYYSSFFEWRDVDGKLEPIYDIHRATSPDGFTWTPDDVPTLGLADQSEGGLARAQILQSSSGHLMIATGRGWRDFRGAQAGAYRLIFARSEDGVTWTRDQTAVTIEEPSHAPHWASEMRCYPWIVSDEDRILVFFNGNNFGRDGFGVGELRADAS